MPRPEREGPICRAEKKFWTIVAWAMAAVFLTIAFLNHQASSKPALLCKPDKKTCIKIVLPKPGKCKWISGYKVCR